MNGASARRLRLADAKGLVSRVRRKAIYGRVVGFPSVYAELLPLGTRSNSAFFFFLTFFWNLLCKTKEGSLK